jgi:subfamily B ATP-binding cassette protein HlyB/CyaB
MVETISVQVRSGGHFRGRRRFEQGEGILVSAELPVSAGTFAWGLQGICQLLRVPFAQSLVLQQFPPPYSLVSFQRAAHALGLKSGLHPVRTADLPDLAVPYLAILAPGTKHGQPQRAAQYRLAIVVRCDPGSVLFLEDGRAQPVQAALDEFATQFAGQVLLFAPAQPKPRDEDAATAERAGFGFRWFVPELLRHKAIWRDVLLASLAIQLMALATPVFTQIVIDKVIVHHTLSTLVVIGIALALFVVFTAVMSWVRQYLVLHTGNRIDAVLGSQVFEHLFRLPPRYFEHRPTGVLVARVHGVETIREFLSSAAVTLILDVPFLFIFLALMFYYSVTLTLITVAVLLLIVALSFAITPLLRQRLNRQFLLGARNQAFLTEYVSGMETVKSLQMEPQLERRFGDYLASYLQAGFSTRQLANTYNVAAHALEQLLTLAILCAGAWLVMTSREFTIGMLVAFQMFAGRLSQPMLHLAGLWQQFQQADIAVRRLGDVMNAPPEPYSIVPAREAATGEGRIAIRNLSFRHAENLPWLYRAFELDIEPGRCVALMGPSGCGKSTLAKLLQGFYQPDDGSISIDGRDIRHLAANELREHFGVVPQETVLFSGRIYDNLVLANPHATFERVVEACKLAEIHDAIEALPEGYQTEIGEHGTGLSGGQKQRIAIARALLKRPRVLIFDEATASLDTQTAELFARTVNQFRGRVTMLFIAHQLPRGLQVDAAINLGPRETRLRVVSGQPQLFQE